MIELSFLPWVLTISAAATIPVLLLGGKVNRWLGARRNRAGKCAHCAEPPSGQTCLVHGLVLCERCTVGARARLTAALWLTTGAMVLAPVVSILGFIGSGLSGGFGWWHWFHAVPLLGPGVIIGTVAGLQLRRMKRANQRALGAPTKSAFAIGPGEAPILDVLSDPGPRI